MSILLITAAELAVLSAMLGVLLRARSHRPAVVPLRVRS